MKLSIIIPLHNSSDYFNRIINTLEPYLNDNFKEIIFIDDFSSDDCVNKINKYIKMHSVNNIFILKNKSNMGPSYTRNRGLEFSKGEYIAFLDADDSWHRRKVDIQIEVMEKHNILISGTSHKIINNNDLIKERNRDITGNNLSFSFIKFPGVLFKSPFATPSVMIHKSLKKMKFNESLYRSEDYNLWVRMIHQNSAIKIKFPLTYTFKHDYFSDNSLSSNLWEMQKGSNQSYFTLLKSIKYSPLDKFYIICALLFSQVKFFKRFLLSIIKSK